MIEPDEMIETVHRYIEAVSAHDVGTIKKLYADSATVEDPVGTDAHVGMEAIVAFYQQSASVEVELELTGPVRCAGNAAVFPFFATTNIGGKKMRIDIIDVFEFNDAGLIQSMRAYWGPENCTQQ